MCSQVTEGTEETSEESEADKSRRSLTEVPYKDSRRPAVDEDSKDIVSQEAEVRVSEDSKDEQKTEDTEDAYDRRSESFLPKILVVEKLSEQVNTKVRETSHEGSSVQDEGKSLQEKQKLDKDLGRLVSLRLASNEVPGYEDLSVESEVTKKLCLQWENLEVHDGLVCRRFLSQRGGEPDYLQLLVRRSDVDDVLRQCHAGVVGGQFGIRRTRDQVKRRYYWPSWKHDTRRFCQRCLECNTYHRGKPKKQGPLKPVLAPLERWYIDLTGPHPKSAKGNIWILTCMDGFTKWAKAIHLEIRRLRPLRGCSLSSCSVALALLCPSLAIKERK